MIIDNIEQRSLDWFRCRIGCVTGSKIGDLMKSGKKKEQIFGDTAMSYIFKTAAERMINPVFIEDDDLVGQDVESQQIYSKGIVWGQEREDNARELMMRKNPEWELADVSSCKHDTIPHFAASPDAIVYDRKKLMVVEIKCPQPSTFAKYLVQIKDNDSLKNTEPNYYYQMMAEMACTGAESGIFVAYCPWLINPIHIVPIERDNETIKAIEERVIKANEIVEQIINGTYKTE